MENVSEFVSALSNFEVAMIKRENKVCLKGKGYFQSMYDRHVAAAKDASSSGDLVAFEYNMQYAEHFVRVMNEKFQSQIQQSDSQQSNCWNAHTEPDDEGDNAASIEKNTGRKRLMRGREKDHNS